MNDDIRAVNRVTAMLKLDFYRLFHTPLFYIMLGIAAVIPALILTMTGVSDPQTGAVTGSVIENAWTLIARTDAGSTADFGSFATVDMVFIFAGILTAIFVSHDYSSGFVKNIFTVHSQKQDYALSKTAVGVFSGAGMILTYTFGTVLAGLITGKSFEVDAGGLIFCLLAKISMMPLFCSLFLAAAIFFKDKLWLTIVATFLLGMILYPAAGIAGLDAGFLTFITALAGSGLLGYALNNVSQIFLKKRDLI